MKRAFFIATLFCLFSFKVDNGFLYRKLKFADFKEVNYLNDAIALSSTGIVFDYEIDGDNAKYFIKAKFYPNDSYIVKGNFNNAILSHEQKHFDITKIFSDILANRLNILKNPSEKEIISIYEETIKQWDYVQELYDEETDHSKNELKQNEWNLILNRALNKDYLYLGNKLGVKINF